MVEPNVPVEQSMSEPSPWLDIADELRKIAADVENYLAAELAPSHFAISIHPYAPDLLDRAQPKHRPAVVAAVDAVALGLLGKAGSSYAVGGGFHHGADAQRGPVEVRIYQAVADPAAVDPDEEIARLRAENEALRAKLDQPAMCGGDCTREAGHLGEHHFADPSGLTYTRADDEPDDPTPVSPARVPLHVGGVADEGLVDETPGAPSDGPHPSWPTERELKPWESLASSADRAAESVTVKPIDPDSSMEAHYDAEADRAAACLPECGGGRQCRCQGGWS